MRIFLVITVLFISSACTPEIRSFVHQKKYEIATHSYGKTFKDFFLGDEINPSIKYQKEEYLKNQCTHYSEKRVRYVTSVNDEAWYDQCPPAAYPQTGPERLEMTARPPYTKIWSAKRVHNYKD